MGKYKVLFQGTRTVVVQLKPGLTAQDLVNQGVFIQGVDGLYTKDGKRVIISKGPFVRMMKPRLVSDRGLCGGSVFEIVDNTVKTAAHVLECVDRLLVDNRKYVITNKKLWAPKAYPSWLWAIFKAFDVKPISSYDYGEAEIVNYSGTPYNATTPPYKAIYVAGNCHDVRDVDCLGIALATPDMPFATLFELVDRQLILDCTYWNYTALAWGVDIGESFVDYGGGKYALLKPALLLRFLDKSGIPGCSGSMVYPV